MAKSSPRPRRLRTRIVPIAILAGTVAASVGVIPSCEDSKPSDMGYPADVSAHAFFDLARNRDLAEPVDGGSSD